MRHRVQGRKLGLPSDQRMALLKNLVRQTPGARAHHHHGDARQGSAAHRGTADARRPARNTLHARRLTRRVVATNVVGGEDYVKRLFDDIAPRFRDRPGGYTRIIISARGAAMRRRW